MATQTRYTINSDGTLQKWYLDYDDGDTIILRTTPQNKWSCYRKEFPAAAVYPDHKTARAALRARTNRERS